MNFLDGGLMLNEAENNLKEKHIKLSFLNN
jgi:hypothetical protein